MRKILIITMIMFCLVGAVEAAEPPKEIITESTYIAGDNDTPTSAEDRVKLKAEREALEQCGTFVTSSTTIQNFTTKDDTVKSIAAAVMEVVTLDRRRTPTATGTEYYIKIRAIIHPEKLNTVLNILQSGAMPSLFTPTPSHKKVITTLAPEVGNKTMNLLLLQGVKSNDLNLIKKAVENGANVNIYNGYDCTDTPLTLSLKGNIEIFDYLVEQGADVNAQVFENGWLPPLQNTPLIRAIYTRNIPLIEKLIKLGSNVNFSDKSYGSRPLGTAIGNNLVEITKLLIANHAEIDYEIKESNNCTPLMLAIKQGNVEIVQLLLDSGASKLRKDNQGRAPLDYAVASGNKNLIYLLMN